MLRIVKLLSVVLLVFAAWIAGLRTGLTDQSRQALLLVKHCLLVDRFRLQLPMQ